MDLRLIIRNKGTNILVLIFLFMFQMYSTNLAAQKKEELSELRKSIYTDYFETKKSIKKLPKAIKKYLKKNGIKFRKKYKKFLQLQTVYDGVYRIPRLIAVSERYCLINYFLTSRGGHTLILKIVNGEVTDFISLDTPEFKKISNLKYYFSNNEYDLRISNDY